MVNSPLIRPYFGGGGGIGGGTLNSHDIIDPFCIDSTHLHQGLYKLSGSFKQFPCSPLVGEEPILTYRSGQAPLDLITWDVFQY